jgi:glycosyltransferase involved in cell wall biosynthesis
MANALSALGYQTSLHAYTTANALRDLHRDFGLDTEVRLGWSINGHSRLHKRLTLLGWLAIAALRRHDIVLTRSALVALLSRRSELVLLEFHQNPLGRSLSKKLNRVILLLFRSDRVKFVVITERLRDRMRADFSHLDSARFVVAPSGFRADWYPAQWKPSSGHGRIAYVGSLYPGRGVEMVIELARRLPDVEVLVAGGSAEQWESLLDGSAAPNNCIHLPHVPPVDVPDLLRSSDVLVAPYQAETFIANGDDTAPWASPLKVVEYMAAGRAIVTSDLPMTRELLTDAVDAALLPPTDIDAWEQTVRVLLQDAHERDRIGKTAHTRAHSCLSWDRRLARILNAFR